MNCPIHNKPMRNNGRGFFCATKLADGSWCKEKGTENGGPDRQPYRPQGTFTPQPPKENRNWDKEAYEKCCSIWSAAILQNSGDPLRAFQTGSFWELFQAIRQDADKRFATGWNKAEQTFRPSPAQTPSSVVNNAFQPSPSDDYERANREIDEALGAPSVEDIPY